MTISSLYHTQEICGYKYQKTEHTAETEIYYLHSKAKRLPCPACRSRDTTLVRTGKTHDIQDLFMGHKNADARINTPDRMPGTLI